MENQLLFQFIERRNKQQRPATDYGRILSRMMRQNSFPQQEKLMELRKVLCQAMIVDACDVTVSIKDGIFTPPEIKDTEGRKVKQPYLFPITLRPAKKHGPLVDKPSNVMFKELHPVQQHRVLKAMVQVIVRLSTGYADLVIHINYGAPNHVENRDDVFLGPTDWRDEEHDHAA